MGVLTAESGFPRCYQYARNAQEITALGGIPPERNFVADRDVGSCTLRRLKVSLRRVREIARVGRPEGWREANGESGDAVD